MREHWADIEGTYKRRASVSHACKRTGLPGDKRRGWDNGPLPEGCTGAIAAGETYVEYVGESAPFAKGERYCNACSVAAGLLHVGEA